MALLLFRFRCARSPPLSLTVPLVRSLLPPLPLFPGLLMRLTASWRTDTATTPGATRPLCQPLQQRQAARPRDRATARSRPQPRARVRAAVSASWQSKLPPCGRACLHPPGSSSSTSTQFNRSLRISLCFARAASPISRRWLRSAIARCAFARTGLLT